MTGPLPRARHPLRRGSSREVRRGATWVALPATTAVPEPVAVAYGLRSGATYEFRVTALDDPGREESPTWYAQRCPGSPR